MKNRYSFFIFSFPASSFRQISAAIKKYALPLCLACGVMLLLFIPACQDGSSEEQGTCSDDMVLVGANASLGVSSSFCIDKYEASRPDATDSYQGSENSMAFSKAGVIPWYPDTYTRFTQACTAAGKRICEKEEWLAACAGSQEYVYVYGDTYDVDTCNVYTGAASIAVTGSFSGCVSANGIYDLCGNVAEVVHSTTDGRGYEVRGGAYNIISPSTNGTCSYNYPVDPTAMGFRCCGDPEVE